jgi:hypothetical protein
MMDGKKDAGLKNFCQNWSSAHESKRDSSTAQADIRFAKWKKESACSARNDGAFELV